MKKQQKLSDRESEGSIQTFYGSCCIKKDLRKRKLIYECEKKKVTGLNEQMSHQRFTRGKCFSAGKNDFPFNTTCTAGGLYTASLHTPLIQSHFRLPPRLSSSLPVSHPPNISSSTFPVLNAAGHQEREGGRQPESQITKTWSHLALTHFCSTQGCFSSQ